jgi:Kef-type K+ transport system membrane component KefB
MPHHMLLVFLLQVGILLVLALLLGRVAERFGLPAVAGELCVGIILGPSLLQHIAPSLFSWLSFTDSGQVHLLDAVGQIGVLLLVGLTGINLDLSFARRRTATAVTVSLAGLVVPLGLGVAAGFLVPASLLASPDGRTVFALFLGVAMCVSAVPVIAKTLIDMDLLHRNIGQLIIVSAVIDDTVGWLMLAIVSAMAIQGLDAGNALQIALSLVLALSAAMAARPLVRRLLRSADRTGRPGPPIAMIGALLLLWGAATHTLGLEAVFGAFLCGVVIRSCGGVNPSTLAALRTFVLSVLAPIFFATVGLRTDLTALGRPAVAAATGALLAVAIVGKFAGAYLGAMLSRLSIWEATALGAGMNSRGVIQIIVATVGLRLGVLTTQTYTIIVVVAIITSLTAGPVLRWAAARIPRTAEERQRERTAYPIRETPALETGSAGQ